MRRSSGISLLEIVLVIAIIASILLMAVRYFTVATRDAKVGHTMKQIQTLTAASYEWLQAQKQPNFSGSPSGTAITLQALIDAGLIEDKPINHYNQWGGTIVLGPGDDSRYVKITVDGLPQKDCLNLSRRLLTVSRTEPPACRDDTNNTYSGDF